MVVTVLFSVRLQVLCLRPLLLELRYFQVRLLVELLVVHWVLSLGIHWLTSLQISKRKRWKSSKKPTE